MLDIKHPLLLISDEIMEICKPLARFQISVFTYTKNFYNGSKITLSNQTQWVSDYYNLKLYQSSLFEANPHIYQPGYNIWIGDYDIDVFWHGKNKFNSVHSITITQPQTDSCEFFFFSVPQNCEAAIHYLYNNMDILYHFILYFKDKATKLLAKADKHRIILPNSDSQIRQNNNIILPHNHTKASYEDEKKHFFQETHVYKYTFESGSLAGINLSNREIDCIFYLLNDMTSDEIAHRLRLSKRTIDYYLDNVKLKLNVDTRSELTSKLKQYKILQTIR